MKVKAFIWRCFLDRVPTRATLEARGIINTHVSLCCFYGIFAETINHLFLDCVVASLVWNDMAEWIGWKKPILGSMKEGFMKWHGFFKGRKVKKGKNGWCGWLLVGVFGWLEME